MSVELLIGNELGTKLYIPVIEEGVEWTTERKNAPGKLTFKVLKDNILDFSEGSKVTMQENGDNIFFGFVFKQQRDKGQMITVTAYDQLRYLKNKDTIVYENKTADQFVQMVAADYSLNVGMLENTKYVIESRVEENTSLFEMIENALDLTLTNTGEMFVLYDDFGKLMLSPLSSMMVGNQEAYLMIDEETGENFEYTSSIDDSTYNKIKLTYDNEDSGIREVYIAQDSSNINKWGVLQYFDTLKKGENGQAKADALLKLYNKKTRNLKLTNILGDNRVRAGSMIVVNLDLGDVKIRNFMLVESCKHIYKENEHWMDLTLRGVNLLGDANGFVEAMKRAARDERESSKPVDIYFGEVISNAPLKINVEQKMILGEAQLILTRNVTNYTVTVSVQWTSEKNVFQIYNALKAGEKVILIRQQGGQKFIVIDRIGGK